VIQLEPTSAAPWAKNGLQELHDDLRAKAVKLRQRGAGHLPIRQAANYVADAYDRAAAVLRKAHAEINPDLQS
jgi:hypothetical protein